VITQLHHAGRAARCRSNGRDRDNS
jgi:hypothetical protein